MSFSEFKCRQNWSPKCENQLNLQINKELNADINIYIKVFLDKIILV